MKNTLSAGFSIEITRWSTMDYQNMLLQCVRSSCVRRNVGQRRGARAKAGAVPSAPSLCTLVYTF